MDYLDIEGLESVWWGVGVLIFVYNSLEVHMGVCGTLCH